MIDGPGACGNSRVPVSRTIARVNLRARIFVALALVGIVTASGCDSNSKPANAAPTTLETHGFRIYHGGTIITMEPAQPRAEAVVVDARGRIARVGSEAELRSQFVEATTTDLQGRYLLPGFIEQHLHPFLGALTLSIPVIAPEAWTLPGRTWPAVVGHDAYLAALTAVERSMTDPDEILWTWGFNQYFHGALSRSMLDAISQTRPIGVWHRSAHEFYVNSAFIERFGIGREAIERAGPEAAAQIDLDRGHFYEAGAMLYLLPVIFAELGSIERFRKGLVQMVAMLHRTGVTAFNEPGAFIPPYAVPLYEEILGAESTPMYAFFIPESKTPFHQYGADGVLAAVERTVSTFGDNGKVRFLPHQVKLLMDGAIISQLMQMTDGYDDGHRGEWIQAPTEVDVITRIFWNAGYQIHVHVNGDAGLDSLIEILRRRMDELPREDHRFTIVHFANSTDAQIAKLAALGAIVSANPYYVTGFAETFARQGLGPERAHAMVRLGPAERAGISISLHSDLPMAPADPLFLAWSATTRTTNEGTTLRPDLALSRDTAMRAITIDAAYSWRMDHELGSIKAGKIANFTILERDPYAVPADELKDIPVYGTVFEGRLFPVTP